MVENGDEVVSVSDLEALVDAMDTVEEDERRDDPRVGALGLGREEIREGIEGGAPAGIESE